VKVTFQIGPREVSLPIDEVLLAGYTGRDRASVLEHIHELESLGVAPPPRVPMVYVVDPGLLTTDDRIVVRSSRTSGEVEFFLIPTSDGLLVGLGSDHTDREHEAIDVAASKSLCPKVISREVWRLADVADHWDDLEIGAWATVDGKRRVYQEGTLASFLRVDDLLDEVRGAGHKALERRLIFGGTLAVSGGFAYADRFECRLRDPVLERALSLRYVVVTAD